MGTTPPAPNQLANIAGAIPFDGDYFGRLIRDDVSDRGRQAELRRAEANLRQLTGAAATNPEIARVAAINFDRGNDELSEQRYRTRADTTRGHDLRGGSRRKGSWRLSRAARRCGTVDRERIAVLPPPPP